MHFSTSFIALFVAITTAAALPAPEAGKYPAPAHPPPPRKGARPPPRAPKPRRYRRGDETLDYDILATREIIGQEVSNEDVDATLVARTGQEAEYETTDNGEHLSARNWPNKGWHPGWGKPGKGHGWGWGKPGHPGWHPGKKWRRDVAEQQVSDEDIHAALVARSGMEAEYESATNEQQLSARNWPAKGWHPGWGRGWGWGNHGKKWRRDTAEQQISDEDVYAALVARSELEAEYEPATNEQQISARNWPGKGWHPGWGKPSHPGWNHGGKWKRDVVEQEASNEDIDTTLVARADLEAEDGTTTTEQELSARWLGKGWHPGWGWWGWKHGHHGWKRDTLEPESEAEEAQDLAIRAFVPRYGYGYHPQTGAGVNIPSIKHANKQRDISGEYTAETGELATRNNNVEDLNWEQDISARSGIEAYEAEEQEQGQGQEIATRAEYEEEQQQQQGQEESATTTDQANNNNNQKEGNNLILGSILDTRNNADYDKYNHNPDHKDKDKYKDCHDKALKRLHKCLADLDDHKDGYKDGDDKHDKYEKGKKVCYKKFEKWEKDCY